MQRQYTDVALLVVVVVVPATVFCIDTGADVAVLVTCCWVATEGLGKNCVLDCNVDAAVETGVPDELHHKLWPGFNWSKLIVFRLRHGNILSIKQWFLRVKQKNTT